MIPLPLVLDLMIAGEGFDDFVFYGLDTLPVAGQELKTSNFSRSPGGGAVITSIAAARLGIACGAITAVSDDAVRVLRIEQVRLHNLLRRGEAPAITVALSTPRDRSFVTFNGVNDRLPSRIRRALRPVRARHVHFALNPSPCRPWLAVLASLRRRGISTSWDFGWNPDAARDRDFWRLAGTLDYVFLNRDEALSYAGTRTLKAALARWRRLERVVVIKLGAKGSCAVGAGHDVSAPARRTRVVDTTGAGDAFNAGFLAAQLHGADLRAALRRGNRIGALSTRRAGGIAGLPRRQAGTRS
jgi:sugar/nucleoside kinase (ribokinase family)